MECPMLRTVSFAALAAACAVFAGPAHAQDSGGAASADAAKLEAVAAIGELAGRLKEYLGAAIKEQGAAGAVAACKQIAPEAAASAGEAHTLTIRRTALKLRNPANAPDAFEARVLASFVEKAAAGADVNTLAHGEIVDTEAGKAFRFMKAIPMAEQPCSACHGGDLKPDVAAKIREIYPQDQATGFKPGEIRGAFSVTKPLI